MATVHGFGDSFTLGCCTYNVQEYSVENNKVPLVNHTYIDILAGILNMDSSTMAYAGCSNADIMLYITNALVNIKPGDIVIVGLTDNGRMNFPYLGLTANNPRTFEKYPFGDKGTKGSPHAAIDHYTDQMVNNFKVYSEDCAEQARQISLDYAMFVFSNEYPYTVQNDIWMERWNNYFKSIAVKCYWWDHTWWNTIPEELKCDCLHWSQEGHILFARLLRKFMFNNNSGKVEPFRITKQLSFDFKLI